MKVILLSLFLTSCGVAEQLSTSCGKDIEMGCNAIFGFKNKDQDKKIEEVETNVISLKDKLDILTFRVDTSQLLLQQLSTNLAATMTSTNNLVSVISQLRIDIQVEQTVYNNKLLDLTNLMITNQVAIATTNGQLTTLNNTLANTVVAMIDPCGDASGYDEVIIKTRAGEYLAYMETAGKRYLTKLTNGVYVTTDGSSCTFTVAGGNLTW